MNTFKLLFTCTLLSTSLVACGSATDTRQPMSSPTKSSLAQNTPTVSDLMNAASNAQPSTQESKLNTASNEAPSNTDLLLENSLTSDPLNENTSGEDTLTEDIPYIDVAGHTNPSDVLLSEQFDAQRPDISSDFVDLTTLSSTMVYAEVYNMLINPDAYIGKTIKMQGTFNIFQNVMTGQVYTACLISDAAACCSEGVEFVLGNDAVYPDDYPSLDTPITVTGTFQTYEEDGMTYCHLVDATMSLSY